MVKSSRPRFFPGLLAAALAVPCAAADLSEADFLVDLPVVLTSSRLAQSTQDAPNAISVIDRAMIVASGFNNVADLLRLVPGFYIGRINGFNYTVSNAIVDEFSRQMQVLVDGRSVYLPSVGGVRWDTLPLAISDIDRIEVVRGPNAASYGANALTGVINIITRHPAEVEGRTLGVTLGASDYQDYRLRWAGGTVHKHRLTLAWHQDQGFDDLNDGMRAPLLNYYGDFDLGPGRGMSVQFGYVGGERDSGSAYNVLSQPHDERIQSQFQQVDYRMALAGGQELLVKAYHNDQVSREDVPVDSTNEAIFGSGIYLLPATYTRDLAAERWHGEVQWNRPFGDQLRMTLGGYGRRDAVNSAHYFNRADDLVTWSRGLFAHAEWRPAKQWLVNAGAMWEMHDLGGNGLSPRLAITWQPGPRHSLRYGVSRAFRNPVQFEKNADWKLTLNSTVGPLTRAFYRPNPDIRPERVVSHEVGYLGNWPEYGLSADVRVYRDSLDDLVIRSGAGAPYYMANAGDSVHWGADGQLRWRLSTRSFEIGRASCRERV